MFARKLEKNSNKKDSEIEAESRVASGLALQTVPKLIPLVFKLGFVYLRFKRKAKKAGKIFNKELIANGIDKETAKLLTDEYMKGAHIMRGFDFSNMVRE